MGVDKRDPEESCMEIVREMRIKSTERTEKNRGQKAR